MHPPPVDYEDFKDYFKDYDKKDITEPECASCHATIDPLTYPWRNYNGLTGTSDVLGGQNASGLSSLANLGTEENLAPLSYALPRLEYFKDRMPDITNMPEVGYIFGQRVETLHDWAQVMADMINLPPTQSVITGRFW